MFVAGQDAAPATGRYLPAMGARRSLLRRVRELPPPVADGLLAALIAVVGLTQLFYESPLIAQIGWDFRDPDALAVLLTLGQPAPLVWRRRAPRLVLAVTYVAAMVNLVLGYQPTWAQVAMLVALYTVAAHCPRRQSVATALLLAGGLVAYGVIADRMYPTTVQASVQDWVFSFLQVAAAWFLGDLQHRRLAYTAKLEQLNAQLAGEQELRARWAVAEERGRIARELHDVVAHSVSVMVVQAGAARRSVAGNPGQATAALTQIEATGRQALAEMRRLLGLLRDGTDGAAALAPQPSLAHLDALLAAAREAGLPVELAVEGEPRQLPAGIDLSAYRIVQEALTNSLKHAGPARAVVRIRYGSRALEVQVWDDGRGTVSRNGRAEGDGHGLIGMRERVALFGGSLEVGSQPGGGFLVAARLPLDGGDPS
jgi:signal transduction histidine kinase